MDALRGVDFIVHAGDLGSAGRASKFVQITGDRSPRGMQRPEAVIAVFQAQTNHALTARFGIAERYREDVLPWCRDNQRDAMQDVQNMAQNMCPMRKALKSQVVDLTEISGP